jgi:hypothetical protein
LSLPLDLIDQSEHLARRELGRPKQASLRRSVSAAYYAVYHLLAAAAVAQVAPGSSAEQRERLRRALKHVGMKQVCKAFAYPGAARRGFEELVPPAIQPRLSNVAQAFVALQEAREAAEYALLETISRQDALAAVAQARQAVADWNGVRKTSEAANFLLALVMVGR